MTIEVNESLKEFRDRLYIRNHVQVITDSRKEPIYQSVSSKSIRVGAEMICILHLALMSCEIELLGNKSLTLQDTLICSCGNSAKTSSQNTTCGGILTGLGILVVIMRFYSEQGP